VWLIDSPEINAAALGGARGLSRVLVTRGLLDQFDRDETSGVVAHLTASIGGGDLRLMHAILAVFQTFGFFLSLLDLPFRWSAWTALGGLALVASGVRRDPAAVAGTLEAVEGGMGVDAMPDIDRVWSVIPSVRVRKVLLVPLLPLMLISMIMRLVLFLWTALFLGPPLAMIWRNRRYAADAMGATDAQSGRSGACAGADRRVSYSGWRGGAGILFHPWCGVRETRWVCVAADDDGVAASTAWASAAGFGGAGCRWRGSAPGGVG
jgi:hypothetical protein